jgi:thiosulfate/3-mercaptopyruvate sulfurtransferase
MPPVLVSLEELEQLPAHARVVDARWKLGDPSAGRAMFEQGHIPGAVYVDMDQDLAAPPGQGGRHPLPSPEQFAASMSRAGIGPETWVIAYDDGGAGAARLWWLLRHFGHDNVSILDGGYPQWLAAGGTPEAGRGQSVQPAQFEARPRSDDVAELEDVRRATSKGEAHLLDARAPERWRGDVEPVDRLAGRIPGSVNAPSGDNLREGRFRSPDELREQYEQLGVLDGKPIIASCGSGVSACVDLVALELAGVRGARLYPGSFSGWIAAGQPVETGPAQPQGPSSARAAAGA